jgi:hypothetical protein
MAPQPFRERIGRSPEPVCEDPGTSGSVLGEHAGGAVMTGNDAERMQRALADSLAVLSADRELGSVGGGKSRRKWEGAWWHAALLCEMGEARRVPRSAIERALGLLRDATWPRFVVRPDDRPTTNADRAKMDCCHCAPGAAASVGCRHPHH